MVRARTATGRIFNSPDNSHWSRMTRYGKYSAMEEYDWFGRRHSAMQVKSWRLPRYLLDTIHHLFLQFHSREIRNESEFMRDKVIPAGLESAQRELEAEARKRP